MKVEKPTINFRQVALSGARWTALARFIAELATFASAVALARLIPPADFGQAAVALIVVALAAVLGTTGLAAVLVQRRDLGKRHVESATFLVLTGGALMVALTALFGFFAAPAIFDDQTARLILLASPAWLLVGLGATSQALLQRELRFRRQAMIEGIAVIASVCVALGAALAGLDGQALVAGALTLIGTTALLSLLSAPPGVPKPSRQEVVDIWRFGAASAGSSLAYLGYRNVDYAILGAQASATQVGFYWRAFQLGVGYQGKISRVMLRISLPLYSRAAGLEELRRIRTRIVRTHATILIPLLATFIGVAPVLVPWLFGPTWEPTVLPSQILAVAGMADAVMTGSGPLMVAIGRPGALMTWNLAQLVLFALLVALLAPHGITVLAAGVAGFGLTSALGMQGILLRRYLGLSFRRLWLDVQAGALVGALVLVATTLLREGTEALDLPDPVAISLLCVAAGLVGGAALRTLFHAEWDDVISIAGRGRRHSSSSAPSGDA
jgi:O-antigen/teichoic acid export membrane protein